MKPLFMFNKWRGINDRTSERDLPDVAVIQCENWEIDEILGDLILGKGYSEYYSDDLGGNAKEIIIYQVLSDGDARIFFAKKSQTELVYWKNDGSIQTLNFQDIASYLPYGYGTLGCQSVNFTKNYDIIFGGTGNDDDNVPFWFGHIERGRFRNNTDTAWLETQNDYYFLPEECTSPYATSSLVSSNFHVVIHSTGEENVEVFGDTYWDEQDNISYTASLIYENGQESYPQSNESGNPAYASSHSISGSNINQVYFSVSVNKNINPRCVGVNIWMRLNRTDWRLVKTLWFDGTETPIRDDASLAYESEGRKHYWIEDPTNDAYWRCYMREDSSNFYRIHVTYSEWVNATSLVNYYEYEPTSRTMPNYTISHIYRGVKYVAKVKYPPHNSFGSRLVFKDANENTVYHSVQDEPNIIPDTNFIAGIEGKISGIGHTIDRLLIFTEENLNIYYDDRRLDKNWSKNGCVSHWAIQTINGICYWPGRDAIYKYDRFFPEDITSFSIYKIYKNISLDDKRNSSAIYDEKNKEYVLTIPNYGILKYNVLTNEWTTKSSSLIYLAESSFDDESYGITDGASRKVVKYNDGYSFAGDYYTATVLTKPMVGNNAEAIIKSLISGYCQYITDNSLTIRLYIDSELIWHYSLIAQTGLKPQMFGMPGINGENVQLGVSLTTSADTTQGRVGFIKLFGEIHDIMGDQ